MQIILLATGETDKLRPLTNTIPAPMLPVANRPVMVYTVEMLARQGFKQMLVSLYHLGGSVEAYFGDGRRWGVAIEYSLQREPWGSAGALKWAERSLTERFMVFPADAIIDLDVQAVLAQHQSQQSLATLVLQTKGNGQPLFVTADGRLTLDEDAVSQSPCLYHTGVCIFEPQVMEMIPPRTRFDLVDDLLPALLAADVPIHHYQAAGYWNPLANFMDYQSSQSASLSYTGENNGVFDQTARSLAARQIGEGIWVGRNHIIHPSVRLAPPVYIGDNCQIGKDVSLGPEVVLGKNVIIDDEATILQSTILDQTYVGQLVDIDNRVVNKNMMIDVQTAESMEVVDGFLLGEAHPALLGSGLLRLWDTAVSLLLLLLTLPFTLPLALLTLLTTGRVLASLPRMGMAPRSFGDGRSPGLRSFSLLRFCTQRKNGQPAALGRWLEKWDGHRLPELLNVLRGDMSLVGVKPLSAEAVGQIHEAWQEQRHSYQSGFTGLWYLQNGRDALLDEILISDTYYVATRTWREDRKILWQTPAAWLNHLRRSTTTKLFNLK